MTLQRLINKLPPAQRTRAIQLSMAGAIGLFALALYYASGQDAQRRSLPVEELRPIALGDHLIEDDMRAVMERDRDAQKEHNQAVNEKIGQMESTVKAMESVLSALKDAKLDTPVPSAEPLPAVEHHFKYPPPVAKPAMQAAQAPQPFEHTEPVYIGGIEHVEGAELDVSLRAKKNTGFYLPPSFMEAMLLTGLKAETVEAASKNPEPMVLRVQKPAILPNRIKADLKGCFVIAHGFGKLSSERVDARLVSLHCLAQNGQAVIDQEVKGFVVDADGSKGLRGIAVTKMGANLARSFLAGVFGGLGQAVRANATTVSVNPNGAVQTFSDGAKLIQAGIGQGIGDAAADIRKVYLDLVRQAAPVIEIGPAKQVTVVLTEGVNLKLRNDSEVDEGVKGGKRS